MNPIPTPTPSPTPIPIPQSISSTQEEQLEHSQNESHQKNPGPLSGLYQALEASRIQSGIPGMSVAVIHKGRLIFAEGFGKRNDSDPFTVETRMPIASLTKAFTAATVGELVGEGKVDWDTTPVSKYLPEFELQDPVFTSQLTLQDLLSHRTGLPSTELAWYWNTEPRRELIKRLKYIKSGSKLRSQVQYSNVMYAVAGEAVANVAGIPFEDLVREKVIKPLGLSNTGFSAVEMIEHPNYALPYEAESFEDAQNGKFKQLPLDNMATAFAAGGDMYSNVLDLVRWGQAIMNLGELDGKQVLNKDSVMEILSGQSIFSKTRRTSEFAPTLAYGVGWLLDTYKGNIMYHHAGHNPGFISKLVLLPDSELVIAHLANIDTARLPVYSPYYIADKLLGLSKTQNWIAKTVDETRDKFKEAAETNQGNFPKRIENKPSTHELSELVGVYSNPIYDDISIRLEKTDENEGLYINFRVFEGKLEHYRYDSFSTVMCHSKVVLAQIVTFETSQDGKIVGFQTNFEGRMQEFKKNV
ncbi:hypothetical protein BGX26_004756 [Mortierella sp. AD094]|nr:hypothetical protein BGX26_004756 [Mortierella sp. AD094]